MPRAIIYCLIEELPPSPDGESLVLAPNNNYAEPIPGSEFSILTCITESFEEYQKAVDNYVSSHFNDRYAKNGLIEFTIYIASHDELERFLKEFNTNYVRRKEEFEFLKKMLR